VKKYGLIPACLLACSLLFTTCTDVPPETAKLSATLGTDILSLKASYIALINAYFNALEQTRIEYLDNEWTPKYIEGWVKKGRLVDMATGKVVWSYADTAFKTPGPENTQKDLLNSVNAWSSAALNKIAEKRKQLLDPLEVDRQSMLLSVGQAFDRIYAGNTVLTNYLDSALKVKSAQNDIIGKLNLSDLQKEINEKLLTYSQYADTGLSIIRKADGIVDKANGLLGK
jgi:hypothetical protein